MSVITNNCRNTLWEGARRGRTVAASSRLWYYLFTNEFFHGDQYVISPEPKPDKVVTVAPERFQGQITYTSITNGIFHLFIVQYRKYNISPDMIRLLETQAFEATSDLLVEKGCRRVHAATIIGTKIRCWHLEPGDSFLSPDFGEEGARGDIKDYVEVNSSFAPLAKVSFEIMKQEPPGPYPSFAVPPANAPENIPPPANVQQTVMQPWSPSPPPTTLIYLQQQLFIAAPNPTDTVFNQDRWYFDEASGSYLNHAATRSPALAAIVGEEENVFFQEFLPE
ncbi:hypothetical protein L228DRAFT_270558 [Xylona heveae TC161]|uniref:Uncharacterized protein n=1 Tax=Xylona heveae (strain CBS 132557 / TC161) TaxID=1328760 RepID=A0A165AHP1_XYLHT|nr:hypothetical protein L228DRAFT_270558 [Xylona heveae TC161]KZF20491.1 hypothetical protein L228DRAFT_270558 [Xylona heveae TC161]